MEIQEFRELLLESLKDPDIIDAISSIQVESNHVTKASDEEFLKYTSQIADLKAKNILLTQQVKHLKANEENIKNMTEELHRYQSLYASMFNIYDLYIGLSEKNREALKGIFKNDEPALFIASGVQQGNIESLWEYIKIQIMKRQYEDIPNMAEIIYYFIDLYNSTKNSPVYEIIKVEAGDIFDVEMHIRTSESKPAGKIQKAVLYGFKNINTNLIIKKSVVVVV